MSCSNCTKTFSIFTKEKSCKNCALSFCSGCIKTKMIIPKSGAEGNVCRGCEQTIRMQQTNRPPPDALQRRLNLLENPPAKNPITVYTHNRKMSNLKRGLSVEDKAIADRLEKLQRDRKASMNIPTEAELKERLIKLKDHPQVPSDVANNENRNLFRKEDKSKEQTTRDLLEQAQAEVKLENKMPKPEDEIRDRLAKLRGHEIITHPEPMDISPETFLGSQSEKNVKEKKQENMTDLCTLLDEVSMEAEHDANIALKEFESDKDLQKKFSKIMKQKSQQAKETDKSDSEQDEDEAEKIVIGILSEENMDEQSTKDEEICLPDVPTYLPTQPFVGRQIQRSMEEGDKELPWCIICNENAVLRCVEGCDGDLYCSRCFKECHDEMDLNEHKTKAFKSTEK